MILKPLAVLFTAIFTAIAQGIVQIHRATGAVLGTTSGVGWVAAIILLTVAVRLLLFPVFVKQIKTQRSMQVLQPKIKALQAKHKGDRETLNTELMKLYKEHGANPLAGCLPLLLQMPIFIGMFRVLRGLGPTLKNGAYVFPEHKYGVSRTMAMNLSRAKIFGAPIGAAFTSPAKLMSSLSASVGSVKIVAGLLILFMTLTQFVSSKQLMGKQTGPVDAQQQTQQRVLLYVMPLFLAVFGFQVPLGVLIYWTTSNLWSMGQQAYVIKRMPAPGAQAVEPKAAAKADKAEKAEKAEKNAEPPSVEPAAEATSKTTTGGAGTTPARPPNPNRSRKKGKGRRGGRR